MKIADLEVASHQWNLQDVEEEFAEGMSEENVALEASHTRPERRKNRM